MSSFVFENTLILFVLPVAFYILWKVFNKTWHKLDEEAYIWNIARREKGEFDFRPWAVFTIGATVLAWQNYYGGGHFYRAHLYPLLSQLDQQFPTWIQLAKYQTLYAYAWWELSLTLAYVVFPFTIWKFLFPQDALLDFGLRTKNFFQHTRLYGLFLGLVVVGIIFASFQSNFVNYYPYYKGASRSWFDLLLWEAIYLPGFFALEIFFRGWWLVALRKSLGSAAIFTMTVPYCMIHFGKPYLETMSTLMGAVALGSLSMKTKSVYQGTFLHITMALAMDLVALAQRGALPTTFWP